MYSASTSVALCRDAYQYILCVECGSAAAKHNDAAHGDINHNLEFVCCFPWLLIDSPMAEDICASVSLSTHDSVACNDSIESTFL